MRRREFLTTLGASSLAARSAAAAHAKPMSEARPDAAPPGTRPDILLVLADQWNPRCGGFAGDRAVPTAHLDRLAADGIVFENHYTPCLVCMPARCSLLTGLYPHNTALWGNNNDYTLPPESGTMFQDLRRAGYTTAQIGKLHWNTGRGWRRNFDRMECFQTTQTNLSVGYKNMMERMTERDGGRGKGLSDRLYEKLRERQQSHSGPQK